MRPENVGSGIFYHAEKNSKNKYTVAGGIRIQKSQCRQLFYVKQVEKFTFL